MRIIGGLFDDKQDLNLALEDLQDKGFVTFKVFGPSELYRSTGIKESLEESLEEATHTAAGTVEGVTFPGSPATPDDPSAQPVTGDFLSLGIPEEAANVFVAGLHQDQLLLLVQTKAAKADEAAAIMAQREAQLTRTIQPTDAFPEEQWV